MGLSLRVIFVGYITYSTLYGSTYPYQKQKNCIDISNSTLYGSSIIGDCGWMGQARLLGTTQVTHTPGVSDPEMLCRLHVTVDTVHVNKNLVLNNNTHVSINDNSLSIV